jgi:hypothetical protein
VVDSRFSTAAAEFIDSRIERLRQLTYAQARALPKVAGEDVVVAGAKSSVTVFRQDDPDELVGRTLITVLVARPRWLGLASYHIERGLVFSLDASVREATEHELQNSGG